ncbi:hypothetical protein THIOM_004233 [Candidatus Thiomargarita nelsonii]|uniref:Uncharacterized protein n=1 Tax=Candidatus Thiomargarita nelsonii TaxID=1003181 RepID=A0A176RWL7_9GAMM|nr:hypothetical protein THIOM_004233 [Candidatus Thiomargarita nelsonii]
MSLSVSSPLDWQTIRIAVMCKKALQFIFKYVTKIRYNLYGYKPTTMLRYLEYLCDVQLYIDHISRSKTFFINMEYQYWD